MVKCCAQIIVIGLICGLTLGSPHERFERSYGSGLLGILGGGSSRHDYGSSQGSHVDQQVSEVGSAYGTGGGYGGSGRQSLGSSGWQQGASGVSSVQHHSYHGYRGVGQGGETVYESGVGRGIGGGHEHVHGSSGLLGGILGGHRHSHQSWNYGLGSGHGHTHQGGRGSTHSDWYHGMSHGHGSGHYEGGHGHMHGGENLGQAGSVQEGFSVVEHGQDGTVVGTGGDRDDGQVQGVRTYTHTVHYQGVNQGGAMDNVQGQVQESGGQVLVQEHDHEGGELDTTDDQDIQQGVRTYTHTVHYQGVTQEGVSPYDKDSVQEQVHESEGQVLVDDDTVSKPTSINGVEHVGEGDDFGTGSGQEVSRVQQGVRTQIHRVTYHSVKPGNGSPSDKEITQEQVDESGGQIIVQDITDAESTNVNGVDHDLEGDKLTTGVDQDQDASQVQHGVRTYVHRVSYHGVTQDGSSPDKDDVQEVHESGGQVLDEENDKSEPTRVNEVENNNHDVELETGDDQDVGQQDVRNYVRTVSYHTVTQGHRSSKPSEVGDDNQELQGSDGQELVHGQDELEQTLVDEDKPDEVGQLGGKQTSEFESTYETQYEENDKEFPVDKTSGLEPDGSSALDPEGDSSKPQKLSKVQPTEEIENPIEPVDHEQIHENSDTEQQTISEVNPIDESDDNKPHDGTEQRPVHDDLHGDEGVGSTDGSNTLPNVETGAPEHIQESIDSQQYNVEPSQKPTNEEDIDHDPKTEGNSGLEHVPDSDQDQQSVSSDTWIYEESRDPGHSQESDELNQKVTKVESIHENKGSYESSPDESTEIGHPHDSDEKDPQKISNDKQVFESYNPSGSGQKPVQGTTGSSTTTRHTVTTIEYVRNNDKPGYGGSRVVEEVYGNDKYSPGDGTQGGENIGQDGLNQVRDNGEITQKEVTTTYSQQVAQGGRLVGNPNLDSTQSGSSSGFGGVVHEVVETVVGHVRGEKGHGQVVQEVTRQGSRVLENVGLGQVQRGGGLGQAGVVHQIISSHGGGVLENVGLGQQQGYSQQVSQVGRLGGNPNLDNTQGSSSSGFGGVVHEVVETVVGHVGGGSGHGQVVQGVTRQGSSVLENVGLGQVQGGSGLGHAGVVQEIVSSHGGGLLGNVGMGQQQGGSGSGHMRVVQEVISSHGGNVLGNVGLGQGGSGSGHMQVVQEVTRQGSTVLENVGLGHSRGVGGLGLGGINRFTSHGTGVLQQVGLGHSYGGRSGVQGYEEGSQSTSSYRTSGGSYGSYNSRSGTSGGGLAGGLLGLG